MNLNFRVFLALTCVGLSALFAEEPTVKELRQRAKKLRLKARDLNFEAADLEGRANIISKQPQIAEAVGKVQAVKSKQPRKILIYSRTTGFRHRSIPMGVALLAALGKATAAYASEQTEDPSVFTAEKLGEFDAILMLNTTGKPVPQGGSEQAAFESFMAQGGGLIGIHAATDCHANWVVYREAMGGVFAGHPWRAGDIVTLFNEDVEHPVCSCVPQGFKIKDEIYQYREDKYYSRGRLRILLSLDLSGKRMKKGGMKRKDFDYPVSWVRQHGKSRVFYSNLGHNDSTYFNPIALQHFLNGIQYVLGDLEADATPSAKIGKGKPKAPPEGF